MLCTLEMYDWLLSTLLRTTSFFNIGSMWTETNDARQTETIFIRHRLQHNEQFHLPSTVTVTGHYFYCTHQQHIYTLPSLSLTTKGSWMTWGSVAKPLVSPLTPVPPLACLGFMPSYSCSFMMMIVDDYMKAWTTVSMMQHINEIHVPHQEGSSQLQDSDHHTCCEEIL